MRNIAFFNIGWMDQYNGLGSDTIAGGGSLANEEKGEVYNFLNRDGVTYGCVQPSGSNMNINRLGAKDGDESIDDILVVWMATRPEGGTVIIGWYKNATVHRAIQQRPLGEKGSSEIQSYYAKAATRDCTLLPVDKRTFKVPRGQKGQPGRSNVWYADQPESQQLRSEILDYIAAEK